eukprot:scaffold3793_cov122-Isochrysis_galbana.AAC.1
MATVTLGSHATVSLVFSAPWPATWPPGTTACTRPNASNIWPVPGRGRRGTRVGFAGLAGEAARSTLAWRLLLGVLALTADGGWSGLSAPTGDGRRRLSWICL